ncbi:zinc metalloproteinase nas-31-like [Sebastes umbrosus]|uniref:zinc metalloproteinase nas-31-like n=1 Tax=Sebastes umbrosus TaxID=72105 RepID=UPI00189FE4EF|nr:zinc metalloproteinase nas-31-like [Sebastes umbrosus]
MWTFIVVFVLLTAGQRAQNYDNSFRGILRHACPDKQVVSQINSSYSSIDQDRQWKIECKAFGATSGCSWSGPRDLYDKELSYNCPTNHVVAGVHSNYNSAHGDRSWKLLCCSAPHFITFECRETPMVNYFNEDFNWELPSGHFLTGVRTHQKNINGDHRWSFNYCKGTTKDTQTINSQILTTNERITDLFTEGDVFVANARNARKCNNCRWPKLSETVQVPYAISDSFSTSEKMMIENAINTFHLSTCIRFVARQAQTDYIMIVKKSGCWSWVGRVGSSQELSLGTGCVYNGIIQHELIHALGFWHEQSRRDRDAHILINFANIKPEHIRNFETHDTNNLEVPYDYSSVMHYTPKDFSKNGGDTIIPIDPSAQIGQREGMTENDILKINKLYDCKAYRPKYGEWDNELNNAFSRTCPSGQAVSGITSLFNHDVKDRLLAFSCHAFKVTRTCKWSADVNEYWGEMDFKCGDNEVIAGAYSDRSSLFQDRKWKFYCCSDSGFTTSNCQKATRINYFEEYFSWTAPSNHYLTGVKSSFDYVKRDRRWTLTYCQGNTQ